MKPIRSRKTRIQWQAKKIQIVTPHQRWRTTCRYTRVRSSMSKCRALLQTNSHSQLQPSKCRNPSSRTPIDTWMIIRYTSRMSTWFSIIRNICQSMNKATKGTWRTQSLNVILFKLINLTAPSYLESISSLIKMSLSFIENGKRSRKIWKSSKHKARTTQHSNGDQTSNVSCPIRKELT